MKTLSVHELSPDTFFTEPVFLDDKYILLSSDVPVTDALIKRLQEWKFNHVLTDGTAVKVKPSHENASGTVAQEDTASVLENDPLEKEKLEAARGLFERAVAQTQRHFTEYTESGELPIDQVSEMVKDLIGAVKQNRNAMLRLASSDTSGSNYLVLHSVKTTILALTAGLFLKFPAHKLIELGMASMVHEIGMIRLPPHLYMSPRILTPQEKRAVMTHPILGFNVLKELSYPMSVASAVLEHHERMDGSGYPRAVKGDKISPYARVIAVCCSYDALISKRPYREGRDGHQSILDLLKDKGVQYDEQVIRALVFTLSVYPLGSYVQLSTGAKAVVVEANPQSPRFPLVKIIADEKGCLYKEPQTVQTGVNECSIDRILTPEEAKVFQT